MLAGMASPTGSDTGSRDESTFRPDVEGLRAVAVMLVVLFHASIGGVAGGFVGVDVFLVLSGFLITGLLLRELRATGTISLAGFYARRVRRLLPAAALVLVVTLAASALVLPPLLVPGVAGDAAAAAVDLSNIRFASQATDYFAAGQAPSPILHFWSLGVEEQFYLFWPAIVLLIARASNPGMTRRIALAVVAISAVSFGLAVWLTATNAPWAFFLLPTRAWELGLGAMLAVAASRLALVPRPAAALGGWIGLGMIAIAAITFDQATPFPGSAALLPTIGTAMVVIAGMQRSALGPARLLGTAVPRFLGRISYSLYLWHWPLLVLPAVALGTELPVEQRVGLVVVAIVLATLTQRWVERPIRRGWLIGTVPRRNLAFAGGLTAAVLIVSLGVGGLVSGRLQSAPVAADAASNAQQVDALLNVLANELPAGGGGDPAAGAGADPTAVAGPQATAMAAGPLGPLAAAPSAGGPQAAESATGPATAIAAAGGPSTAVAIPAAARPPTPDGPVPANLQPSLGNARQDLPLPYSDGCHTQQDGRPTGASCIYGNPASPTTIALFGDSHALAWFPAIQNIAVRHNWRLLSLTMSACSPATIANYSPARNRVSTECIAWRQGAIDRLVREKPAVIIVAGTRGFEVADASGTVLTGSARTRAWEAGMAATLKRLVPAAGRVIVMADTPVSHVDPPVCLSQHPGSVLACATPVSQAIDQAWLTEEQHAAAQAGARFIDPTPWVCPSGPCPVVLGNILMFRDPSHLTATFSAALADRVDRAIQQQLR